MKKSNFVVAIDDLPAVNEQQPHGKVLNKLLSRRAGLLTQTDTLAVVAAGIILGDDEL